MKQPFAFLTSWQLQYVAISFTFTLEHEQQLDDSFDESQEPVYAQVNELVTG